MSNTNQNDANSPNDVMEYFTPLTPAELTSPEDTNTTHETPAPPSTNIDIESPSPHYSPSEVPAPATPAPSPAPMQVFLPRHIIPAMEFQIEMFLNEVVNGNWPGSNRDCRAQRYELIMDKLTGPLEVLANKVEQFAACDNFKIKEIEFKWKGTDVRLYEEKNGIKTMPSKFKFGIIVKMRIRECNEGNHEGQYTIQNKLNDHKREVAKSIAFSCPFKNISIESVILKFIENYELISRWVYHEDTTPFQAITVTNENSNRNSMG